MEKKKHYKRMILRGKMKIGNLLWGQKCSLSDGNPELYGDVKSEESNSLISRRIPMLDWLVWSIFVMVLANVFYAYYGIADLKMYSEVSLFGWKIPIVVLNSILSVVVLIICEFITEFSHKIIMIPLCVVAHYVVVCVIGHYLPDETFGYFAVVMVLLSSMFIFLVVEYFDIVKDYIKNRSIEEFDDRDFETVHGWSELSRHNRRIKESRKIREKIKRQSVVEYMEFHKKGEYRAELYILIQEECDEARRLYKEKGLEDDTNDSGENTVDFEAAKLNKTIIQDYMLMRLAHEFGTDYNEDLKEKLEQIEASSADIEERAADLIFRGNQVELLATYSYIAYANRWQEFRFFSRSIAHRMIEDYIETGKADFSEINKKIHEIQDQVLGG